MCIELYRLNRDAVPVVHREDFLLTIQGGPGYYVVGMERDEGHRVPAPDPANRLVMVSLVAHNPDIMIALVNPTSHVTNSPPVGN
jgi:hypothetical protein